MMKKKISKKHFLAAVAHDSGMSVENMTKAWDAISNGIHDQLAAGNTVTMTGFGSFYLQNHRGHPVQFEGRAAIQDYIVMKFSASDVLNKRFRKEYGEGEISMPEKQTGK
jgi:nucleoid DNA-binding protein